MTTETESSKSSFFHGLKDGIPIALGYFAVSAAYGMASIIQGLTVTEAAMISLTNLTSAGQFAGTTLLAAGVNFLEIAITVSVINARYFLMSLSLNQKIPENTPLWKKMIMAFGVTDEIYAVAMGQKKVRAFYFYGLMLLPILGWTSGTVLGGIASEVLPADIVNALGIAMYGMFIAIFVPAARKERSVFICVLIAVGLSCLFTFCPGLNQLSSGYTIVIVTILAAGFAAWKFPRKDEADTEDTEITQKSRPEAEK